MRHLKSIVFIWSSFPLNCPFMKTCRFLKWFWRSLFEKFFFLLEVKMKGEICQSLKAAKAKPIPQDLND